MNTKVASEKRKKIDMTTGPIMRNILLFALPIVTGNILQQLYTTVDTLVVGRFCGKTSLAAIGTSSQPVEVLLCIFLGIGSGVSILVSQSTGAGDNERIKSICNTAVSFVFMCGVPIGILGYLSTPAILNFMGVPLDAWEPALIYTRVVFLGTLGNIGYNMNAGILRGFGDSKASLWFLVVSCFANIVLDLLLVAGIGMDVSGAALATTISMYISWIVSIVYIRRKYPDVIDSFLPLHYNREEMHRIVKIGLPMGLNNSLFSFGHMAMQTLINAQGSAFMAGVSVAGRITSLSNIAITAMSSAATTFSAQNYGAGKFDRLKKGHLAIPFASGAITLFFGIIILTFRMPLLGMFSSDSQVIYYAARYVVVSLSGQWIFAIFSSISAVVNGVGLVKDTMVVNLLMLWAVRIPVAWIVTRFFDGTWLMIAFPISFTFGVTYMLLFYAFSKKWKSLLLKEQVVAAN